MSGGLLCRVKALEAAAGEPAECLPTGWVAVNADGTVAAECGGATAVRTAIGRYDLTAPAGSSIVQLTVVEAEISRDSIEIHPVDFVGSTVHVTEGDNGGSPNAWRDRAFMAVWY